MKKTLDNSARLKYRQIARTLIREIESGIYPTGEIFPKRSVLAQRFGVTRATIDRSVRRLIDRGLLRARRGAGTYVARSGCSKTVAYLVHNNNHPERDTACACDIAFIPYSTIENKSDRAKLSAYDGLIWHYPEKEQLQWADEFSGVMPQIIVNRDNPQFNFISTDHRGAYLEITRERLKENPQAIPLFLQLGYGPGSQVTAMRSAGFVDACREAERFYELVDMPVLFDEKLLVLRERLGKHKGKKLLLVADSMMHTGAVMAYVREQNLKWQSDILYSDFDNNLPENVWGVKVTSFLQDEEGLRKTAVEKIAKLISEKTDEVKYLMPPRRVRGDT